MTFRRMAVIGLGLIGGSVARGMREAKVVEQIVGFDVDARQRDAAVSLGVVDACVEQAASAVRGADLVLLAVPVLEIGRAAQSVRHALEPGAVLVDVGSTKQSVIEAMREVFGEVPANFVPCHPIAGTERSGVAASRGDLFRGKRVLLTAHPGMDAAVGKRVETMWTALGGLVDWMDPALHDHIFAATSHLPHVLAYTLVDLLARSNAQTRDSLFTYAAGGFRDFTRIASSSPKMWHDIVRANKTNVVAAIDQYLAALTQLRNAIAHDDPAKVLDVFSRARAAREQHIDVLERAAQSSAGGP